MGKQKARRRREAPTAQGARSYVHPPESYLSTETLARLRAAGVHVRDAPNFPPFHVAFPSGYTLILPVGVGGNALHPDHPAHFRKISGEDGRSAMPPVSIWREGGRWGVDVHQYAPGPGPGDFRIFVDRETDLVACVLSYFFDGDNPDFLAAREAEREAKARRDAYLRARESGDETD